MSRLGFEPRAAGLKVRGSSAELTAQSTAILSYRARIFKLHMLQVDVELVRVPVLSQLVAESK